MQPNPDHALEQNESPIARVFKAELLPELMAIHDSLWTKCRLSGRIKDYKAFAGALKQLGQQVGDVALLSYVGELQDAIEGFNVRRINTALDLYPDLLERSRRQAHAARDGKPGAPNV